MATLVRYIIAGDEVVAIFPQLKYNKRLYGNDMVTSYTHIGQHSACHVEWANDRKLHPLATNEQYADLHNELIGIGYELKICKH